MERATKSRSTGRKKATKASRSKTKAATSGGAGTAKMGSRSQEPRFTDETLRFLGELAVHNDREWFAANKARYEQHVREPALAFIRAMAPKLARFAPNLVASDAKVGGSLMRIHRDTRFSRDKSPYKTNVGIQFRHAAGKDVHAPGLYLHIDPGEIFLGAGLWRPDREPLEKIRKAIADDPKRWRRAISGKRFAAHWRLAGDSLKRPPRGHAADHPAIEDLKRKDHIAVAALSSDDALAADLVERVMARFRAARPHFDFLLAALGLPR